LIERRARRQHGGVDTLRPVTADDWRLLREVRLRALADAPDAFGSTLADAQALPDEEWRRRAHGVEDGRALILLALTDDARPVGMGGVLAPTTGRTAWVWGMWTAPEVRGQGLGGAILDELVAWCRTDHGHDGHDDVRLHVTEGNNGGRALYVRRGFAPTGTWEELRPGSPLRIEELSLRLSGSGT
jgi:GNAT superfamily N-acetyltransferase